MKKFLAVSLLQISLLCAADQPENNVVEAPEEYIARTPETPEYKDLQDTSEQSGQDEWAEEGSGHFIIFSLPSEFDATQEKFVINRPSNDIFSFSIMVDGQKNLVTVKIKDTELVVFSCIIETVTKENGEQEDVTLDMNSSNFALDKVVDCSRLSARIDTENNQLIVHLPFAE